MKKTIKVFSIFILLISLGIFCLRNIEVKASQEPEKGDLRCPLSLPSNVECKETEHDSNGKTTKVEVTRQENFSSSEWVKIKKIVKKTDVLGRLTVQFEISANNIEIKEITQPTYVAFILDYSKTIQNSKTEAQKAARDFAATLIPDGVTDSNIYISFLAFADKNIVIRGLENKNFNEITDKTIDKKVKNIGEFSFVDKAFSKAYDQLKNKEGNKYVLLIGDGQYTFPEQTGIGNATSYSDKLRENGVELIIARYPSNQDSIKYNLSDFRSGHIEYFQEERKARCVGQALKQCHYNSMFRFLTGTYCPGSELTESKTTYVDKWGYMSYKNCKSYKKPSDVANFYEMSKNEYSQVLQEIANKIKNETSSTGSGMSAGLEDEIGFNFDLTDSSSRKKNFNIKQLSETVYTTPPFDIEINPAAGVEDEIDKGLEPGWHETNEKFTLTFTKENGEKKSITVNENPELYWIPDSENIYSCSGEALHDTEATERNNNSQYFSKECYEGYKDEKGKYVEGYKAKVKIADVRDGVKQFDLVNGVGFTASVKLSTNIRCTYKFNKTEFMNSYNQIQSDIAYYESLLSRSDIPETQDDLNRLIEEARKAAEEAEKQKEEGGEENQETETPSTPQVSLPTITKDDARKSISQLQINLEDLLKVLDTYQSLTKTDDLENYKKRFNEEQDAIVRVNYENSSDYAELKLDNLKVADNKVDCSKSTKTDVLGKSIENDKTCTLHLEKEMGIASTCISMVDGEQEDCSASSNQLSGGNKFYVDLEEEGSVSVEIKNAGYNGNYDFRLDNDEHGEPACRFTNSSEKLMFRQIELDDPFIKQHDPDRGVGKNYLNNTFNFEKIIHGDTWDDSKYESEYYYEMSKTNIAKIKSDTNTSPSNSYLGQNCYFTNNNKWQCHFTRNELDGGSDNGTNWFYKFKPYEGIN